ncbi:MAG: leucine-rich repeat domain-containing protein, partial [Treponema sp.]|nr:leucine-rich repeat domain-containing protein [Treponema sp.]
MDQVTLESVADLSKIAAASGGASASSPLEVVFTSAFTNAGFAGLNKETDKEIPELDADNEPTGDNITATFVDPLGKLYEAIGAKYVVLNMAESGWTGMETADDPVFFDIDIAGNDLTISAELRGDARDRVVKIILPKKLKVLGANMFCYSAGLKEVSFNGCSELTQISMDAFKGSAVESLDFAGCTALAIIDRDAFSNCRSLKGSNNTDTLDLTPLSSLIQIGRNAFAYAPVRVVKFPAVDALDIDNGAFRLSPVMESAVFTGTNLVNLAMNNFMYYDQPNNQHYPYHPQLKVTHMREITDGAIGPKNDKVYEIFYPESLSFLRTYQSYFNHQDDDGYFQGTMIIPTKGGQDVYRGQSSMSIQAAVSGAPSATVDV